MKIIKMRELRDAEDRKIYQGFYLNNNDLIYIKEKEPGEFYMLSPYSELETKIIFPSVAQGLRRLENIDGYLVLEYQSNRQSSQTRNCPQSGFKFLFYFSNLS